MKSRDELSGRTGTTISPAAEGGPSGDGPPPPTALACHTARWAVRAAPRRTPPQARLMYFEERIQCVGVYLCMYGKAWGSLLVDWLVDWVGLG